jgi:ATP-binding cassette subfamily B protein
LNKLFKHIRAVVSDLVWGWLLAFNSSRGLSLAWLFLSVISGVLPMVILIGIRLRLDAESVTSDTVLNEGQMLYWLLIAAVVLFGVLVVSRLVQYLQTVFSQQVKGSVQESLLNTINGLKLSFFDTAENQSLLQRARSEALQQPTIIFEASGGAIQAGFFLAAIFGYLFLQSPIYVAVIVVCALPAIALYSRMTIRANQQRIKQTALKRKQNYLFWVLGERDYIPELRMTRADQWFAAKHKKIEEQLSTSERGLAQSELLHSIVAGLCIVGGVGLCAWQMLEAYIANELTSAGLVLNAYVLVVGQRIAVSFMEQAIKLYKGGLFFGDFRRLSQLGSPLVPPSAPGEQLLIKHSIQLKNIEFTYPGAMKKAVDNISMRFEAGTINIVRGANGTGKSTLFKILAGLYRPDSGDVLLDGVRLEGTSLGDWKNSVSLQVQHGGRYPETVRNNVALGRDITDEKWRLAADLSGARSEYQKLKDGERTPLMGPMGGVDLSGGQWQKMFIARAFSSKAQVILLDEPTAFLDAESRAKFWKELVLPAQNSIVIIISHDNTVKDEYIFHSS